MQVNKFVCANVQQAFLTRENDPDVRTTRRFHNDLGCDVTIDSKTLYGLGLLQTRTNETTMGAIGQILKVRELRIVTTLSSLYRFAHIYHKYFARACARLPFVGSCQKTLCVAASVWDVLCRTCFWGSRPSFCVRS